MQSSEHGNRSDGSAGEIGRDVMRDACKAQNIDVQHLASLPRSFEVLAGVVPQAEVQAFASRGLLDHVGVALELVADCGSNEISAVGVEPVLHHEIDMA